MELLYQKTRSSCGQTCVAMIAGISWEKSVELVGHKNCTKTRELVKALRTLGFSVEDHLTVLRGTALLTLPQQGTFLLKLRYPGARWHWVVLHEGHCYDPAHGFDPPMRPGWKYSSYLKVSRCAVPRQSAA